MEMNCSCTETTEQQQTPLLHSLLICSLLVFFYRRRLVPQAFGEPTWAVISLFTASFFSLSRPEECE